MGAINKILNKDNVQLNSEGTCNHTAIVNKQNYKFGSLQYLYMSPYNASK